MFLTLIIRNSRNLKDHFTGKPNIASRKFNLDSIGIKNMYRQLRFAAGCDLKTIGPVDLSSQIGIKILRKIFETPNLDRSGNLNVHDWINLDSIIIYHKLVSINHSHKDLSNISG